MSIPAAPPQAPRWPRPVSAAGHEPFLGGGAVALRTLFVIRQFLPGAILAVQGFHAWQPNGIDPARQAFNFPNPTRVILTDGTPVLLASARLSTDSQFGNRRGPGRGTVDSTARFAVSEIARIEERRLDERQTVFDAIGAVSTATLVLAG